MSFSVSCSARAEAETPAASSASASAFFSICSALDNEFDIAVRTGYHCAPLVHDFIGSKLYKGTIRVSVGYFNTYADIDKCINALGTL